MLESLSDCIEIVGPNSLTPEQIKQSVDLIKSLIEDYHARAKERVESTEDQDYDKEEEERLDEEREKEEEILTDLVDLYSKLIQTHRENFVNAQGELMQIVIPMLQPGKPSHERQVALCFFDDIVEHGGQLSQQYYPHFVPLMMEYARDTDPGVRQAAVFGIGVCSQFGGDMFKSLVTEGFKRLLEIVQQEDARSETNVNASENAISSMSKIIRYQTHALLENNTVNLPTIMGLWLNLLPVEEDELESKVTYDNLCFFLEDPSFSPHAFGNQFQNLPKILSIFGQICETSLINDEIHNRIVAIVKRIIASCPPDVIQQLFTSLSNEHKTKLQRLVS